VAASPAGLRSRPGGNITGSTNLGVEIEPKLVELLHDAVPSAKNVAVLINPTNFNTENFLRSLQSAARTFGLQLHVLNTGLVTNEVGVGLRIAGHQRRNRVEPTPRDFQRIFCFESANEQT
jgi:ABC-type uncharacterized transport system substrate-binding protein